MSAVSPTNFSDPVSSLFASSQGDMTDMALALMAANYQTYRGDLTVMIKDIESKNAAKQLWNQQLQKLNKMMEDVAAQGKDSNKKVTITVSAEDLPYKDYKLATSPADGTSSLVPTSTDDSNKLCTGGDCVPVYGAPETPVAREKKVDIVTVLMEEQRARLESQTGIRGTGAIDGILGKPAAQTGPITGYKLSVSADEIKSAIDNVRSKLDNLNTDNEIAMLRMNDTFQKANMALEQMSKFLEGQNDCAKQILANSR